MTGYDAATLMVIGVLVAGPETAEGVLDTLNRGLPDGASYEIDSVMQSLERLLIDERVIVTNDNEYALVHR